MINISVVNHSTLFPAADLAPLVAALQIQVSRDFYPVWGVDAHLDAVPPGANPPPGYWVLGIFDDADQAGALGYHDVTPDGLPIGKVFVRLTLAQGSAVSSTASHELCEMLVDPDVNLCAEVDNARGVPIRFYAYEVCDAPEADAYNYMIAINGVNIAVSDFVYPSWFESFRTIGPFDFGNHITRPFQILPGGYIGYLDVGHTRGWQQLTAHSASAKTSKKAQALARPHPGSRRARRAMPREDWLVSEYAPGPGTLK